MCKWDWKQNFAELFNFAHQYPWYYYYYYYYCQALSLGRWRRVLQLLFCSNRGTHSLSCVMGRHSRAGSVALRCQSQSSGSKALQGKLLQSRKQCSAGTTGFVVFLWVEFTYMIWIHKVIKVSRDTGNYFADFISSDNLSNNAPHGARSNIPASTAKIQTSTESSTTLHSPWPWGNHFWAAASELVALS